MVETTLKSRFVDFRIELGEIEAVLREHPQVREAALVVHEDKADDRRLITYIVPAHDPAFHVKHLRSFLQGKLPEYMVPTSFVESNALPRTPNGKLDRWSLPAIEPADHEREESYVAPTSLLHYQLISIWEELLDTRPIGIRDNFFYLGGHSLLAARLIARIEQVFGKRIPLATLFAGPTIEHLADALTGEKTRIPGLPSAAYVHGVSAESAGECV